MSKVKNVSGSARYVPLLGREVADGETVDVPDFQPAHDPGSKPGDPGYLAITWPAPAWEPVAATPAKTVKADDTAGKVS